MRQIRKTLKAKSPLIHCITNPISINQCANAILAVGARPMMAEHPKEVAEIVQTAGALLLNLGNITDIRMQSMQIASATASKQSTPVVLDAVGVACSSLRRNFARELLKIHTPQIIKGNASEIFSLCDARYTATGVDADAALDSSQAAHAATLLAQKLGTVVLVSGKTDIITNGKRTTFIHSGTPQLTTVTGTGCILGALCAGYLSVADARTAAKTACAVLSISGQLAETNKGSGSFTQRLMDKLCTITDGEITKHLRLEETEIEKL